MNVIWEQDGWRRPLHPQPARLAERLDRRVRAAELKQVITATRADDGVAPC
jgi:hypothetical protein